MLATIEAFAVQLQNTFPAEIITMFISMLPLIEIRGAIPIAIGVLDLSAMSAYFWATLGNIIPNFFILLLLPVFTKFCQNHSQFLDKIIKKIFHKTRTKHSHKFNQYGALFLILFVAIPIPGSGSWTGSLVAFLFGVPFWPALGLISVGVACAGLIITGMSEAVFFLVNILAN